MTTTQSRVIADLQYEVEQLKAKLSKPQRERLPDTRDGATRKFKLTRPPRQHVCPKCNHQWEESRDLRVYATVGCYPDGRPGELFVSADRVGTLAHGALNAMAIAISVGLQHGVPLAVYLDKFIGMSFDAGGLTGDSAYPRVASILDYVARWLRDRYCPSQGR